MAEEEQPCASCFLSGTPTLTDDPTNKSEDILYTTLRVSRIRPWWEGVAYLVRSRAVLDMC